MFYCFLCYCRTPCLLSYQGYILLSCFCRTNVTFRNFSLYRFATIVHTPTTGHLEIPTTLNVLLQANDVPCVPDPLLPACPLPFPTVLVHKSNRLSSHSLNFLSLPLCSVRPHCAHFPLSCLVPLVASHFSSFFCFAFLSCPDDFALPSGTRVPYPYNRAP